MVTHAARCVLPTTQSFDNADLSLSRGYSSRSEASSNLQKPSLWIYDRDTPITLEATSRNVKHAHHKAQQKEELSNNTRKTTPGDTNDDAAAIVASLQACIKQKDLQTGRRVHNDVAKRGLLAKHPFLGNMLLTMYAKCGALGKAQELFDHLAFRTVVSWNALIAAYAQYGHVEKALHCFKRMQSEGFFPNQVTFICILKACGGTAALEKCLEIHAQVSGDGSLMGDVQVGTALVDMYAKSGLLADAQEVFNELPTHNIVTWTALIGGYVQHGYNEEALDCFARMESSGFSPNVVTYVCILKACGSIGAVHKGQEVHATVVQDEVIEEDMVMHTALVDMYADWGMLAEAQEVFDDLCKPDVVAWNALLSGYAHLGKEKCVFESFDRMIQGGNVPSFVTFTILLNICSHVGLLDTSQRFFEILSKRYGILPTLEHHTCMVDLFGRAGHLEKAVMMIESMPFSCNSTLWNTLLGACWNWANVKLGRWVFEHALRLDQVDTATHICMRNIHAAAIMRQNADKIEALRGQNP